MNREKIFYQVALLSSVVFFIRCGERSAPIDRFALVSRHNVVLNKVDTLGSLSVGNGEFAFTVDVSGLQSFPDVYENGIPLGTQSQWAWHKIPTDQSYSLADVMRPFESCDGTQAPYAIQHAEGEAGKATQALRANPHRLHLGLIGLEFIKSTGEAASLDDLTHVNQKLNLWTGEIESTYQVEGIPVRVSLYGHQTEDRVAASVESPLIQQGRLKVKLSFPYGNDCHVCPGYDWTRPDRHQSVLVTSGEDRAIIGRHLDSTTYFTQINWTSPGELQPTEDPHQFKLIPAAQSNVFEFTTLFHRDSTYLPSDFETTQNDSHTHWEKFWRSGGAIDFSECTDPRAPELERRMVLSQYLTKIQCAGSLPPQETGLTMNSWFGKFHIEMHWWHAAHFPAWGRAEFLEKGMNWYQAILPRAVATAKLQGYQGARWPKMTDPYGSESPSGIGAFIIWQQPHPIYFAELLYRNDPSAATLARYQEIVFQTADFMASFVRWKEGRYHLCHPLIPAQEIFKATETDDPPYELQYWYWALTTAQEWRTRAGLEEHEKWKDVLNNLTPLPVKDNLYLPVATAPSAYTDDFFRRDHPAVTGALGFLPHHFRVDTAVMRATFHEIMKRWQWESTWGWDYPLLAMTAARLYQPEDAVAALLMDVQKNTYLVNGHNYQDKRLRLYLPGNGGLLAALALMTAGWDGNHVPTPGFPKDGRWNVKWEGLRPLP